MTAKGQKLHRPPTPKQMDFIDNYTTTTSKTYGNKTQSYISAGFKARGRAAQMQSCRLAAKDNIREVIAQKLDRNTKRNEITGIYADEALIEFHCRAVMSGDLTNEGVAVRLLQQRCGQLSDKLLVSVEDTRQLEDSLRTQAKQIASLIVNNELPEAIVPAQLPASCGPVSSEIPPQAVVDTQFESDNITESISNGETQTTDNNEVTESSSDN